MRLHWSVSEWLKEADCKSAAFALRRFESFPANHTTTFGLGARWLSGSRKECYSGSIPDKTSGGSANSVDRGNRPSASALQGNTSWQTSSLSPRGGDFIRIVEWAREGTHENEVQDWLDNMHASVQDSMDRFPHLQKRVTKERQKEKRERKAARKAAAALKDSG